jgi:glycosyltransferase involved in cell wall biosynthesis
MKIAYLINHYPQLSHTFIRREIAALEDLGIEVQRISVRPSGAHIHAGDTEEASKTWVVLKAGLLYSALAVGLALLRHPISFYRALAMALRLGSRKPTKLPHHVAYFLEACVVLRKLRQVDSRHLHAHFGTNPATVALLTWMLGGPPYSFTVHGPEEFDHPFELGLPEKIGSAAFVAGVSSFGRSQLYRWTTARDWDKIKVIHCALGESFFNTEFAGVPDSRRFVCVGRLCEQKGQLLLAHAMHVLTTGGVECQLILVGDGPMRGLLEGEIKRLNLEDRIHLIGAQGEERVLQEIGQARAFVLPSFAEGLPVVLMEALALNRPVISTFVAGIPELVIPEECGWLIPAGSVEELAGAMKACLETPVGELDEMGRLGARRIRERHRAVTEARKLRDLFVAAGSASDAEVAGRSEAIDSTPVAVDDNSRLQSITR